MSEAHAKTLLAAQGYAELGMFDDALAELDTLPEKARQIGRASCRERVCYAV